MIMAASIASAAANHLGTKSPMPCCPSWQWQQEEVPVWQPEAPRTESKSLQSSRPPSRLAAPGLLRPAAVPFVLQRLRIARNTQCNPS